MMYRRAITSSEACFNQFAKRFDEIIKRAAELGFGGKARGVEPTRAAT
jgi:hypothetical protein